VNRRDKARARADRRKPSARRRLGRLGLRGAAAAIALTLALVLPWRWLPPPTTAFMLRERLQGGEPRQHWVPLSRLSRHLALCVVAAEDQKFPEHFGFDFDSIGKALGEGPRPRGASTLSQQLAKNLYLWPERSLVRKGLEAWLTLALEATWPKRRILEVYLNVAEFGPGVYGAGAAARRYFRVPASQLTLEQAALLAAVLPSPRRMSAARPSEYVRGRAGEIAEAARALGPRYIAGL